MDDAPPGVERMSSRARGKQRVREEEAPPREEEAPPNTMTMGMEAPPTTKELPLTVGGMMQMATTVVDPFTGSTACHRSPSDLTAAGAANTIAASAANATSDAMGAEGSAAAVEAVEAAAQPPDAAAAAEGPVPIAAGGPVAAAAEGASAAAPGAAAEQPAAQQAASDQAAPPATNSAANATSAAAAASAGVDVERATTLENSVTTDAPPPLDPAMVTTVKMMAERSGASAEAIAAMLSLDVAAVHATLTPPLETQLVQTVRTIAERSGMPAEAIAATLQINVVAVRAALAAPTTAIEPMEVEVGAAGKGGEGREGLTESSQGRETLEARRERVHAAARASAMRRQQALYRERYRALHASGETVPAGGGDGNALLASLARERHARHGPPAAQAAHPAAMAEAEALHDPRAVATAAQAPDALPLGAPTPTPTPTLTPKSSS